MDTITLKSMRFIAGHGVYDSERQEGNRFELDVILRGRFYKSAIRDELSQTIDYQEIESIASAVMQGPSLQLIETLCKNIGDEIFSRFDKIQHLELALRKMNPPLKTPVEYAEIRMQWQR